MHASCSGRQALTAPRWHHAPPRSDRQRISRRPPTAAAAAIHDNPSRTSVPGEEEDIKARHRAVMRQANRSRANLPTALASLEQLLATQPNNPHLLVSKGVLCSRLGDADAADAAFTAAAAHAPDDGAVFQVGALQLMVANV